MCHEAGGSGERNVAGDVPLVDSEWTNRLTSACGKRSDPIRIKVLLCRYKA